MAPDLFLSRFHMEAAWKQNPFPISAGVVFMLCGCTNVAVSAGMVCCPHERKRADGKARVMDEKKVKCRECGKRATQYEGLLPTRGVATVLLVGLAIYIAGMWVLSGFAASAVADPSEAGMMDLLLVAAGLITLVSIGLVVWMYRPKQGAAVICSHCGARYTASKVPTYLKGWNYDKIAPALALEATGEESERIEDAVVAPAQGALEAAPSERK